MNTRWIVLCCALSASLGGCKRIQDARRLAEQVKAEVNAGSKSPATPAAPSPGAGPSLQSKTSAATPSEVSSEDAQDGEVSNKLGKYITCFNHVSSRAAESKAYYLRGVKNPKTGPTGKERPFPPYELYADQCFSELDEAAKMKPLGGLDAKAVEYKAALAELDPLLKEARKYYDQRDYLDDKFAKGKELHPRLMSAWERFEAINDSFKSDVVTLNDGVKERALKRLAADPKARLQFLTQSAAAEAKKLVLLADVEQLAQLDMDKYEPALKSLEQAWNTLEEYVNANKAETARLGAWSIFDHNGKDFLKAAKELGRRKRDKKDFNREFFSRSNPKLVDGHPAQVIDKYNSMINGLNTLHFR